MQNWPTHTLITALYLAAYHQVGETVHVGSYRENRVVDAVLHVLRHPGLQKMLQDVRSDVLLLKDKSVQQYRTLIPWNAQ